MKFSEKIYLLRTQYDYSQEAFAEKIGVSRQAVSKWELGTALPDTEKIITISEIFDVSIDSLLKDSYSLGEDENLDHVVIKFLHSAKDMDTISDELLDIVEDGIIDADEKERMSSIVETLDTITEIIREIKQKMHMN